jgi:glycosyltransferase involved in cell wall biosynthesis
MKVAVAHDWLVTMGGAERVLEQILAVYPEADLFTLVDFLPERDRGFLGGRRVRTSFLQKIPGAAKKYRSLLPLMPAAAESLDLMKYDLVVSSSHAAIKGVRTRRGAIHVCYCHTPARYVWDMREEYLRDAGLDRGMRGAAARLLLWRIREWDRGVSAGVTGFIANSAHIARRILRNYGRDSAIIHPPVDTGFFTPGGTREDFYATASRMVPYKKMDLIAAAFSSMPGRRLVVMGGGPEMQKVKEAAGPNVSILGHVDRGTLRENLRSARAFIFAAREDFGIAPVEAQACGTPVIALGEGGTVESVRGPEAREPTGLFFPAQTAASITAAVEEFERDPSASTPENCVRNAARFGIERFRRELADFVGSCLRSSPL